MEEGRVRVRVRKRLFYDERCTEGGMFQTGAGVSHPADDASHAAAVEVAVVVVGGSIGVMDALLQRGGLPAMGQPMPIFMGR